jgi:hypothetical protein
MPPFQFKKLNKKTPTAAASCSSVRTPHAPLWPLLHPLLTTSILHIACPASDAPGEAHQGAPKKKREKQIDVPTYLPFLKIF